MATMLDRKPGVTSGRVIRPDGWTPPDGVAVFSLGSDDPLEVGDLRIGDDALLEQQIDLTGIRLVRALFRFALRVAMPEPFYLYPAGSQFTVGEPSAPPAGPRTAVLVPAGYPRLTQEHVGRRLTVAGAANPDNNGDWTVVALGAVNQAGQQKVLVDREFGAQETSGAFTVDVPGAEWIFTANIDGVERTRRTLSRRRTRDLLDVAVPVVGLIGKHLVSFRLALAAVPSA